MNKLEVFYSDSNYDLEKDIQEFAEEHNVINVVFYTVADMYLKKRAMVIYN
ncbi:hypothetical protein H702_07215 [Streptococcus equinus JB1]|uniref:Uncharacterized protein n=1 Tax=Streptococcus equinus JB1 TaxID=1294274 RepID=A0A091BP52_STREI|nr:hypothetical protein [Streptococcus equinus]KFN87441.1 hypothetical protein H702_07215 [Streptococcus equinus JB1]QBX15705.1 hypothetical protein Javan207_0019 [Streptococcus phage Javan207]SFL15856.1 hypothetical protein SAMN02910290_00685 [Streptococcus equinus JB1]